MIIGRRLALLLFLGAFIPGVLANPEGGVVSGGQAEISQTLNNTQINQTSQKAIIDWQSFNIQSGQTTQFNQPNASSIALNRINGLNGPSSINGNLFANGQVWLINPSGMVFGKGAQINVGGLLATTSNISNEDFMSGNYRFTASSMSTGSIINEGNIQASTGGLVGLIGNGVANRGVINAKMGTVILGGAQAYTLDFDGDKLINFMVQKGPSGNALDNNGQPLGASVSNTGIIDVGRGAIISTHTAKRLVANAINMTGSPEANHASVQGGVITLEAGGGSAHVGGKMMARGGTIKVRASHITAENAALSTSGRKTGGSISLLSSGDLSVTNTRLSANSINQGGNIELLGQRIALVNSKISASGDLGGGEVLIGGNAHGAGPQPNALQTYVDANTQILANALKDGDGGKVVLWSDKGTGFYGSIEAKGGIAGGNGGWVEVSGRDGLDFAGLVNTDAPKGELGTLLLDPKFLIVQTSGGSAYSNNINNLFANNASGTNIITPSSISSTNANIILQANSDVIFNDALAMTRSGRTLTVTAGRSILLNANVSTTNAAISMTANSNAADLSQRSITSIGNPVGDSETTLGNITLASGVSLTAGSQLITLTIGSTTTSPYSPGSITQATAGSGGVGSSTGAVTFVVPTGSAGSIGSSSIPISKLSTGNLTITSGSGGAYIANTGNVTLTAPTLATNNPLTVTSTGTLTLPTATISTGTGAIDFRSNAGSLNTSNTVLQTSGANINLVSSATVTVGNSITTSGGNLTIDSANFSLTANDTINTGAGNITINAGAGTFTSNINSRLLSTNNINIKADAFTLSNSSQIGGTGAGVGSAANVILEPGTAGTTIGLAGGAGGLNLTSSELATISSQNVRIGNSTSGNISINAWTPAANFAASGVLTLDTAGTITQGGVINLSATNAGLLFRDASSVTLGEANVFNQIASSNIAGNVSVTNSAALEVASLTDSLGTVSGLNVGGNLFLGNSGGITQTAPITVTGTSNFSSTGTINLLNASNALTGAVTLLTIGSTNDISLNNNLALILAASTSGRKLTATSSAGITLNGIITANNAGGDSIVLKGSSFTNNVGSSALNPGSGRFLVWSENPSLDTRNNLAYNFKQYNATYGSTAVEGTGSGFLYTIAPTITPGLTGDVSKVYNATTAATLAAVNYTFSGNINGDTITLNNPVSGTYNTKDVGTGKNVSVSGISIASAMDGSATVYGYQITPTANANIGTITAAPITISSNVGQPTSHQAHSPPHAYLLKQSLAP